MVGLFFNLYFSILGVEHTFQQVNATAMIVAIFLSSALVIGRFWAFSTQRTQGPYFWIKRLVFAAMVVDLAATSIGLYYAVRPNASPGMSEFTWHEFSSLPFVLRAFLLTAVCSMVLATPLAAFLYRQSVIYSSRATNEDDRGDRYDRQEPRRSNQYDRAPRR
jgi:hypothetical protein